jgi:hypothetical protein
MRQQSKFTELHSAQRYFTFGRFFHFPAFRQKQREKTERPDRDYIYRLCFTEPHNPMLRDAEKRPVFHIQKYIGGVKMDSKYQIVVIVVDGSVASVYTDFPAVVQADVEVIDFDNARVDADDPEALDKARERLSDVEKEQRQIY